MNDKENIYLDKVVEYLVRDTEIDYETKTWYSPFIHHNTDYFKHSNPSMFFLHHMFHIFSSYCKVVYGLTDQEIEYVWKEYKEIIKDKITNK